MWSVVGATHRDHTDRQLLVKYKIGNRGGRLTRGYWQRHWHRGDNRGNKLTDGPGLGEGEAGSPQWSRSVALAVLITFALSK